MIGIRASPICRPPDFLLCQPSARSSKPLSLPDCAKPGARTNDRRRLAEAEDDPGGGKMCRSRRVAVAFLSSALLTGAYSIYARADVVNLDEFAVVRNGTTIFDDPKSGS